MPSHCWSCRFLLLDAHVEKNECEAQSTRQVIGLVFHQNRVPYRFKNVAPLRPLVEAWWVVMVGEMEERQAEVLRGVKEEAGGAYRCPHGT